MLCYPKLIWSCFFGCFFSEWITIKQIYIENPHALQEGQMKVFLTDMDLDDDAKTDILENPLMQQMPVNWRDCVKLEIKNICRHLLTRSVSWVVNKWRHVLTISTSKTRAWRWNFLRKLITNFVRTLSIICLKRPPLVKRFCFIAGNKFNWQQSWTSTRSL